jgi:hypothetical protein
VDNRPNPVDKSRVSVEDPGNVSGTSGVGDASDLTVRTTLGAEPTAVESGRPPIAVLRGASRRRTPPSSSSIPERALLRGYGLDPDDLEVER